MQNKSNFHILFSIQLNILQQSQRQFNSISLIASNSIYNQSQMQQEQGKPRRSSRSPQRPKSLRFQPIDQRLWTPEIRSRFNNAYCLQQKIRDKEMTEQDRQKQIELDREGQWRPLKHNYWNIIYKRFMFSKAQVRSYGEKYEKACQKFRDYNRRRVKFGMKHLYGRTRSSSNKRSGNINFFKNQFLQAKDIATFINGINITRLEREIIIDRLILKLATYQSPQAPPAINESLSPLILPSRPRTRSCRTLTPKKGQNNWRKRPILKNKRRNTRRNSHINHSNEDKQELLAMSPLVLSFNQQIFKQIFGTKNEITTNTSQR